MITNTPTALAKRYCWPGCDAIAIAPPKRRRRGLRRCGCDAGARLRESVEHDLLVGVHDWEFVPDEVRVAHGRGGVEGHHRVVWPDRPGFTEANRRRHRHRSFRRHVETLFEREAVLHRERLRVIDGHARATGGADRFEYEPIGKRLCDLHPRHDGVHPLPGFARLGSVTDCADNRRTPGCLDGYEARAFRPDPSDSLKLLERFPHPDQPNASAGRIQDNVRKLPPKLLRQLEPHGLLSFDPKRLLQGHDRRPPIAFRGTLAHAE